MKQGKNSGISHYVVITNDNGMTDFFAEFKIVLTGGYHHDVSLIYYSFDDNFIFEKELDALQKSFPTQLLLYFEKLNSANPTVTQETLEVILNADNRSRMYFIISADADITDSTIDKLQFLGVSRSQIQTGFFKINEKSSLNNPTIL